MNIGALFLLLSHGHGDQWEDIEFDNDILLPAVVGLCVGAIIGLGVIPFLIVLFWQGQS